MPDCVGIVARTIMKTSGGIDGTDYSAAGRASHDHVVRLPRCNRVRDYLKSEVFRARGQLERCGVHCRQARTRNGAKGGIPSCTLFGGVMEALAFVILVCLMLVPTLNLLVGGVAGAVLSGPAGEILGIVTGYCLSVVIASPDC